MPDFMPENGRFFKMVGGLLKYLKVGNFTYPALQRTNVRHQAKLGTDQSNCSGDMAIFQFFKMAAVCYLRIFKCLKF